MKLLLLSLLILSISIPGILNVDAIHYFTPEKPKVPNDDDPVPGSPLPYCYLGLGTANMWFCYVGPTPTQAEVNDYSDKNYTQWQKKHCDNGLRHCDSAWDPRLQMAYDRLRDLQNQGRFCLIEGAGIPIIYCFDMDRYFHDLENNKP